jgi:Gpi18-like mannosyltransferase
VVCSLFHYTVGIPVGILVAVLANLMLQRKYLSLSHDHLTVKLLMVTFSLLASPYLLPRMHDRYFLSADVFTILLCVLLPRYRITAIAMQTASLLVSLAFLKLPDSREFIAVVASVFTSLALIWLLLVPPFGKKFSFEPDTARSTAT